MKKVKISELPLCNSLKGLFAIGTDKDNRSVKVSLEFVETTTAAAGRNATDAATNADNKAKGAQTATEQAQAATEAANDAATKANTSEEKANLAAQRATEATTAANSATEESKTATAAAIKAKEDADESAAGADEAKDAANAATESLLEFLGTILPTGLTVEGVPRLTVGNASPVFIDAKLSPEGVRQNIIFISDNKAVEVAPDGRLTIVGKGRSKVQVIPTVNTALAKVVEVVVVEPTLRLVNTRNRLRLTSSGALRQN